MTDIDSARVRWIEENLEITHDKLLPVDVHRWWALYRDDVEQFFSCAIFGYMIKNHYYDSARSDLPDGELKEFVSEFSEKLRRAFSGIRPRVGLPLFDIVGREKMNATPEKCNVFSIRGAK